MVGAARDQRIGMWVSAGRERFVHTPAKRPREKPSAERMNVFPVYRRTQEWMPDGVSELHTSQLVTAVAKPTQRFATCP